MLILRDLFRDRLYRLIEVLSAALRVDVGGDPLDLWPVRGAAYRKTRSIGIVHRLAGLVRIS